MKTRHALTAFAFLSLVLLTSCGTVQYISLQCDRDDIEFYIDDNYVGKGFVTVSVPKGNQNVDVSCRKEGIEVSRREFYVPRRSNYVHNIAIGDEMRYSTER